MRVFVGDGRPFIKRAVHRGEKYDYIDTTVYVEGAVSSGRIQLPIRIARYAGT